MNPSVVWTCGAGEHPCLRVYSTGSPQRVRPWRTRCPSAPQPRWLCSRKVGGDIGCARLQRCPARNGSCTRCGRCSSFGQAAMHKTKRAPRFPAEPSCRGSNVYVFIITARITFRALRLSPKLRCSRGYLLVDSSICCSFTSSLRDIPAQVCRYLSEPDSSDSNLAIRARGRRTEGRGQRAATRSTGFRACQCIRQARHGTTPCRRGDRTRMLSSEPRQSSEGG